MLKQIQQDIQHQAASPMAEEATTRARKKKWQKKLYDLRFATMKMGHLLQK